MAAPASTHKSSHRPRPPQRPLRDATEELGTYQFQVVAASIADAVASIGGLMYDRAMAGWDVSVVMDGPAIGVGRSATGDRPVRILGGRIATRLSDPNCARTLPGRHVLAVAADVVVRSDAVRQRALAAGKDRQAEVLLWGRRHPTNLKPTFVAARHQPSAAAHVFKAHALIAVGAQPIQRMDEEFFAMV